MISAGETKPIQPKLPEIPECAKRGNKACKDLDQFPPVYTDKTYADLGLAELKPDHAEDTVGTELGQMAGYGVCERIPDAETYKIWKGQDSFEKGITFFGRSALKHKVDYGQGQKGVGFWYFKCKPMKGAKQAGKGATSKGPKIQLPAEIQEKYMNLMNFSKGTAEEIGMKLLAKGMSPDALKVYANQDMMGRKYFMLWGNNDMPLTLSLKKIAELYNYLGMSVEHFKIEGSLEKLDTKELEKEMMEKAMAFQDIKPDDTAQVIKMIEEMDSMIQKLADTHGEKAMETKFRFMVEYNKGNLELFIRRLKEELVRIEANPKDKNIGLTSFSKDELKQLIASMEKFIETIEKPDDKRDADNMALDLLTLKVSIKKTTKFFEESGVEFSNTLKTDIKDVVAKLDEAIDTMKKNPKTAMEYKELYADAKALLGLIEMIKSEKDKKDSYAFQNSNMNKNMLFMGLLFGALHFKDDIKKFAIRLINKLPGVNIGIKYLDYRKHIEAKLKKNPGYKVIGREELSKESWKMSDNPRFRNVVLDAGTGLGKDMTADQMMIDLVNKEPWVPNDLYKSPIYKINGAEFQSNTKYRGQVSEKVTAMLSLVENSKVPVVIYMSEMDLIFMAGETSGGNTDVAGKVLLDSLEQYKGRLVIIGTTSRGGVHTTSGRNEEFMVDKFKDLRRRFNWPKMSDYSLEELIDIVSKKNGPMIKEYQNYYDVEISPEIAEAIAKLAEKYYRPVLKLARFPAYESVLQESCRKARESGAKKMTTDHIAQALKTLIRKDVNKAEVEQTLKTAPKELEVTIGRMRDRDTLGPRNVARSTQLNEIAYDARESANFAPILGEMAEQDVLDFFEKVMTEWKALSPGEKSRYSGGMLLGQDLPPEYRIPERFVTGVIELYEVELSPISAPKTQVITIPEMYEKLCESSKSFKRMPRNRAMAFASHARRFVENPSFARNPQFVKEGVLFEKGLERISKAMGLEDAKWKGVKIAFKTKVERDREEWRVEERRGFKEILKKAGK